MFGGSPENLADDFFLSLPSKVVVRLRRLMMHKVCFFCAYHKHSCFLLWLVFGCHIQYILTGSYKFSRVPNSDKIRHFGQQIFLSNNFILDVTFLDKIYFCRKICWQFFFGVTMFWQTNLQPTSLDNNLFWLTTCPTIFLGRQRLSNQHSFLPQLSWIICLIIRYSHPHILIFSFRF